MKTVYVLFETWGYDSPEVRGVYVSESSVDSAIREMTEGEDDYTAARRSFQVKPFVLQGEDK